MNMKEKISIEETIKYLESKRITSFWHFTDKSNLDSILKYGIQTLFNIKQSNIKVSHFGANELSHNLDEAKGLDKYTHLSFIKDHPMYYVAKREKRINNPIWIEIDIGVLLHKNYFFCNGVANSNYAILHKNIKMINFENFNSNDFYTKKNVRKAEILIQGAIEKNYIKGVYNGN